MTVLQGETGKIEGALKTYTVSINPSETTLTDILPTTKPDIAQISFTLGSSYYPTILPNYLAYRIVPFVYVAGKNVTGGTVTVNFEVLVNGISKNTGSNTSVANNDYWGLSWFQISYVASDGDVIEVKLWASVANVDLTYKALVVAPSRIDLGVTGIVRDVEYETEQIVNNLTLWNISSTWAGQFWIYPTSTPSNRMTWDGMYGISTTLGIESRIFPFLKFHDIAKTGLLQGGDGSFNASAIVANSANVRISQCNYLKKITFREAKR